MKYIRFFLVASLLAVVSSLAYAQENTTWQDTITIDKSKITHSARKATLYSAVLPGLGQIYNKKYWKLPLIYGGFAGFGYAINWNNKQYVLYKSAYDDAVDDDPKTNSFLELPHGSYNLNKTSDLKQFAERIKKYKDGARRYRDMNIIFTAAFYGLNIIDASVDAHFFDFDISDDLSFVWTPQTLYCLDQKMIGVNCRINF